MIEPWDHKFLLLATSVADIFSKDPSTKVGAVAVGATRNQVAFGYNGLPPGLSDTEARLHDREVKYALTLHAEENALANAMFDVHTLYITHHPCAACVLRVLARRTVKRVVYRAHPEFEQRWRDSMVKAQYLLTEAGVELVGVGE